jgi:hypothetical protein
MNGLSGVVNETEVPVVDHKPATLPDGTDCIMYSLRAQDGSLVEVPSTTLLEQTGEWDLTRGNGQPIEVLVGVRTHQDGTRTFYISDAQKERLRGYREEFRARMAAREPQEPFTPDLYAVLAEYKPR